MRKYTALAALFGILALTLFVAGPRPSTAAIDDTIGAMSEKSIGEKNAPITIVEYASMSCPHCAKFHAETLPELKRDYIETGKVRLVMRDFPLDIFALKAAMLSRCSGNKRYFAFVDVLFKGQKNWTRSKDPVKSLERIARLGGLSAQDIRLCLANKGLEEAILDVRLKAEQKYQVEETPTFIINGEKYDGDYSFRAMDAVLRKLVPDS